MHPSECELVAIDVTGHTSDYSDKYYTKQEANHKKATLKTILQSMPTQE